MADGWRKIDRGLFESHDGQWRISHPWKLKTELRHRWFVAQRRSDGTGWHMHDGNHATLQDARAYIAALNYSRTRTHPRPASPTNDPQR